MRRLGRLIIGFLIITLCAGGVYFVWQLRQHGIKGLQVITKLLPVSQEKKSLLDTLFSLGDYMLASDNKERTFLVLFQNNWELRPGGGFIGSFGIVKVKNGQLASLQVHDTGNFDGRIPSTVVPPYPMAQTLHIDSWKLRDSNFSPDFAENAKQAEYFYHLGQGQEQFDGVIGVTANVLTSLLDITGPVTLEGFPGTYSKEDGIYTLEYQVEVGYKEQGIAKGERKSVMRVLADAIMKKLQPLDTLKKIQLAQVVLANLQTKDIQLHFSDTALQSQVSQQGWSGTIDADWSRDYLAMVDANLGAYKSDYFIKRSAHYTIDLSKEAPSATLDITYYHTAPKRDWLTTRYHTYLRVYVPKGSWLSGSQNLDKPTFGSEFNKTSFGFLIDVPVTQEKTVSLTYTLPENIKDNYDLKLQKQAGVSDESVSVTVIDSKGNKTEHSITLHSDVLLSEQ